MNATAPIAEQLTAEFGDVLPQTLITSTVAAATGPDARAASETARADVAALADAVVRSGAA